MGPPSVQVGEVSDSIIRKDPTGQLRRGRFHSPGTQPEPSRLLAMQPRHLGESLCREIFPACLREEGTGGRSIFGPQDSTSRRHFGG